MPSKSIARSIAGDQTAPQLMRRKPRMLAAQREDLAGKDADALLEQSAVDRGAVHAGRH